MDHGTSWAFCQLGGQLSLRPLLFVFLFLYFGLLLNLAEGGCGHPSSSSSLVCLLLLYTPTAPASLLGRLNFYIFCFMNSGRRLRKNNIGQKFKYRFSLQEECQLQLFGSFTSLSFHYLCRTPCFLSLPLPIRFTSLHISQVSVVHIHDIRS